MRNNEGKIWKISVELRKWMVRIETRNKFWSQKRITNGKIWKSKGKIGKETKERGISKRQIPRSQKSERREEMKVWMKYSRSLKVNKIKQNK